MRLGRILGPVSIFFNTPFSFLMRHMRMAHGLPNPWLLWIVLDYFFKNCFTDYRNTRRSPNAAEWNPT